MKSSEKVSFLHELIGCFHDLPHWVFDSELQLLSCTSPDAGLLQQVFLDLPQLRRLSDARPCIQAHARQTYWLAAQEMQDGQLCCIHVFGPFFHDNASRKQCEEQLRLLDLPLSIRETLWKIFEAIPLVFSNESGMYARMLHYCLTGSRQMPQSWSPLPLDAPLLSRQMEKDQIARMLRQHELELEMIHMIREGNLEYRKYIEKVTMLGDSPSAYYHETLRQTKNRTYARAGLVTEAAITGGLDVEIALPLLYQHLQFMEDSTNLSELARACTRMEEDFVSQIYRRRTVQLSRTVLNCCDYIQLHLEDEALSRADLAQALNYSEGYLSRKFSQETGMTIKDYVLQKRLERSQELLKNTTLSVQDISARLRFGSPSHFAAAFKKAFGISPMQWRKNRT